MVIIQYFYYDTELNSMISNFIYILDRDFSCYTMELSTSPDSWSSAQNFCNNSGGYLAMIRNEADLQHVASEIRQ